MKLLNIITRSLLLAIILVGCDVKTLFHTDNLDFAINDKGYFTALTDNLHGTNRLAQGGDSPIMQIRRNGNFLQPEKLTTATMPGEYILEFDDSKIQALLKIEETGSHLRLELVDLQGTGDIDLIVWGPYSTDISQIIGETVGVVRDSAFAIGIQSLNLKTLGGYPYEESDVDRAYDIFESNDLVDVADSLKVLYRGHTAEKREYGSVIQAYCRNRSTERTIPNWNHEYYIAPAFNDGGVVGSAIAIFGCPEEKALETLGKIELAENLPHPILDGEWAKTIPSASASYLIMNFGEETLDLAMDLTREAGLKYLYHGGPFLNWGHFDLNPTEFPDNWESLERCVDRAGEVGIRLGLHTLSNFITTNDPYVTPVPDPRLAIVGSSELSKDITASQKDIPISDPKFFNQMKNNTLHSVRIGNEIIRYRIVSDTEPWNLLDCERGAFGTTAVSYPAGTRANKLMDHGYKTFLTNIELSEEVALKIADLYNQTGLRQISFDGLEGNWSTGLGQYGRQRFTQTWYDNLIPDLQGKVITDASNPGHFFWHIYTRMNWGEPWYAGFRESQTQYRLLNQSYYRRNLMPSMLGWFRMTPEISIEDIEWLLARAAGFDAGFALVTSPATVDSHGMGKQVLALIKLWETARLAGAFPEEIKKEMEDINNEYHLEAAGPAAWNLYSATLVKADYINIEKQPGEPRITSIEMKNPNPDQPVQFVLTADDKSRLDNITLDIDGYKKVLIPLELLPSHHLKYSGGSYISLFDASWNFIKKARLIQNQMMLEQGEHQIKFEGQFMEGDKDAKVHLEFRTTSLPRRISSE